jgi:hypothetical protein
MDMFDLPPYVDRCALIRLETLAERRANACVMFIFDILSGKVNSSNLLSLISINAPCYPHLGEQLLASGFSSHQLWRSPAFEWCCSKF